MGLDYKNGSGPTTLTEAVQGRVKPANFPKYVKEIPKVEDEVQQATQQRRKKVGLCFVSFCVFLEENKNHTCIVIIPPQMQ